MESGGSIFVGMFIAPWYIIGILFLLKHQMNVFRTQRYCAKHGKEITGTVVDYESRRGSRLALYSPVFEFRYKRMTERKRAFQSFLLFVKARFFREEEMQIYYCEAYPDFVVIKSHGQYILTGITIFLWAGLLIFFSAMLFLHNFPYNHLSFAVVAGIILLIRKRIRKRKNK